MSSKYSKLGHWMLDVNPVSISAVSLVADLQQ